MSEHIKQEDERAIRVTREFLGHLQERLAYFVQRGDKDRAEAVRHITVGVTKFLEMEEKIARDGEDEQPGG